MGRYKLIWEPSLPEYRIAEARRLLIYTRGPWLELGSFGTPGLIKGMGKACAASYVSRRATFGLSFTLFIHSGSRSLSYRDESAVLSKTSNKDYSSVSNGTSNSEYLGRFVRMFRFARQGCRSQPAASNSAMRKSLVVPSAGTTVGVKQDVEITLARLRSMRAARRNRSWSLKACRPA